MKTALIIALLGFASISSYAQKTIDGNTPELKNNGTKAFVRPVFDRPFKVLFNPPCIEYKRHGQVVMECPGILLAPESGDYDKAMYTGYDPAPCKPITLNDYKKDDENSKSLTGSK